MKPRWPRIPAASVYLWEAGRMRPCPPNLARLRAVVARAWRKRKAAS
jgi:hypothetical protein